MERDNQISSNGPCEQIRTSVLLNKQLFGPAKEFIQARTVVDQATGCWIWQKFKNEHGYGTAIWGGRRWQAHRLAYLAFTGTIGDGLLVCHHCDNPPCCNPAHLFCGTSKDNSQDASRKGRLHGHNKFTDEQVSEILQLSAQGKSAAQLAKQFSVGERSIFRIRAEAKALKQAAA